MLSECLYHGAFRPRAAPPVQQGSTPESGQLAVITCFFNPCGYQSLQNNYFRFAEELQFDRVPLFTAELAFGNSPFTLESESNIRQFRAKDVLWHKERLLNLLLKEVPSKFDKIAWVDADILFLNTNWVADTTKALEEFPVVQLFEEAVYLDRNGQPSDLRTGIAKSIGVLAGRSREFGRYHPGFAWAARREVLERCQLWDDNVVGNGDAMMACAMYGWWRHNEILFYSDKMQEAFRVWGQPFWQEIQGRVGFTPGRVVHLWHGSMRNRRYVDRARWLAMAQFDPKKDLRYGSNGLLEWASDKKWLHERIRQYFFERREDE
jgi:hypothetical protein